MPKRDPRSLRELARRVGVSDRAIRKALAAGAFTDSAIRRDARGVPVVVNMTAAVSEWQTRRGRPAPGGRVTMTRVGLRGRADVCTGNFFLSVFLGSVWFVCRPRESQQSRVVELSPACVVDLASALLHAASAAHDERSRSLRRREVRPLV